MGLDLMKDHDFPGVVFKYFHYYSLIRILFFNYRQNIAWFIFMNFIKHYFDKLLEFFYALDMNLRKSTLVQSNVSTSTVSTSQPRSGYPD